MKYIQRTIELDVIKSLEVKECVAIIGPRQAGKTTLLIRIQKYLLDQPTINADQVVLVTFQNPLELASFEENPVEYVKAKLKTKDKRSYVLIDEFQYAKHAGRDLKLIYDTQPNIKIVITGSSSLELRQISSQMVGRMFQFYLGQLSNLELISAKSVVAINTYDDLRGQLNNFVLDGVVSKMEEISSLAKSELKKVFEELVLYGSYPAIVTSDTNEQREERLLNLYNSYVEKDIVGLLQIGKSEKFLKLVQYMALQVGQLLNQSKVQSELGLTYDEVVKYLSALEETYVIQKVTPYFTNKVNELRKTPIYYFLDTGLRNWTIANFQPTKLRSDKGHLVENVVLKKLLDMVRSNKELKKIYYWRKKSGAEVDFVIERLGEHPTLIPVEVKYQSMVKPEITKSFYSFLDEYQPLIGIVVTREYFGQRRVGKTDVMFVPAYAL